MQKVAKTLKKIAKSRYFVFILLLIFGTLIIFTPTTDPDFGWHFKYGEYLFKTGKLLRENIFSYTLTDYKWADSYWLSELILYSTNNFFGYITPSLILSFIFCLSFLIYIYKQTKDLAVLSFSYLFTITILQAFALPIRPFYYSTIFMMIFIYTLIKKRNNIKYLPILFLVWANMHADFVIALFIFGVYCLADLLKNLNIGDFKTLFNIFSKPSNIKITFKEYTKLFFSSFKIFFACFLITLINPFGISLWTTLLNEIISPVTSLISEWSNEGVSLKNPFWIYYSVLLAACFLPEVLEIRKGKKIYEHWYIFLLLIFYVLSAKAVYFARIYLVFSSFSLIKGFQKVKDDIHRILEKKGVFPPYVFLIFILFLTMLMSIPVFIKRLEAAKSVEKFSETGKYPYKALNFMKENPLNGNVFNLYGWGGYMIWQFPEFKPFVDGRMTNWKEGEKYFLKDIMKVTLNPEKNISLFEGFVDKYNIAWVLDKPDSKLVKYLTNLKENSWRIYYKDDISVVLVKQ